MGQALSKPSHDLLGNGVSMLTNIRKTRMQFRLVADPDERFERAQKMKHTRRHYEQPPPRTEMKNHRFPFHLGQVVGRWGEGKGRGES